MSNVVRYIGGQQDSANLYKLGARYYDATQGRFTQTDPSGQEKNPYAYGMNYPTETFDPSGLNSIESLLDVISWFELADAIASGDEDQIAAYVVSVIVSSLKFAACEGIAASASGGFGAVAGTGVCTLAGKIVAEAVIDQFL